MNGQLTHLVGLLPRGFFPSTPALFSVWVESADAAAGCAHSSLPLLPLGAQAATSGHPRLGGMNNGPYFLTALEAAGLRPRCWPPWCAACGEACLPGSKTAACSLCPATGLTCMHREHSWGSPSLVRTPGLWGGGPRPHDLPYLHLPPQRPCV